MYRVISTFFDRAKQVYLEPNTVCELDPAVAARLIEARCVVKVEQPKPEPLQAKKITKK